MLSNGMHEAEPEPTAGPGPDAPQSLVARLAARWRYWLQPYPPASGVEQLRMLQLGIFCGVGALPSGGYAALHLYLGAYWIGAANTLTTVGFCLVPWIVRRRRSVEVGNHVFILLATSMILLGITSKGGSRVPSIVWAVSPIVIAGLLGGYRSLLTYTAVVVVYLGLTTPPIGPFSPPQIIDLETVMGIAALDAIGAAMVISITVGSFLVSLRLAREETDGALARLAAENESRRAAEAEARQSAEVKSRLLAVMSHELRTPVNGVMGLADILLDLELPAEAVEHLRTLKGSAGVLRTIVDDILDLTKLEAGKIVLDPRATSLHPLVREVVELIRRGRAKADVELRIDPAPPPQLVCLLDGMRLRQVLTNLLGNAMKFTTAGSVRLGVTAEQDILRFEIQDTGIGIPPDRIGALFQPFEQAEASTTRRFGGTGLGLAICKQLVEAMGGTIGVASTMGKGSTFWFELRHVAAPMAKPETDSGFDTPSVPGTGPVLVVDDDAVNRLVATRLLNRLGIETETATNGLEAVARVEQASFRVVLMDVQMPGIDGFEATRRIRQYETKTGALRVPIVGFSASIYAEDRACGFEAGMDDYLSKPMERERLVERLAAVLEGSPARDSGA